MSTRELMDVLYSAEDKMSDLRNEVGLMKLELDEKISMLNNVMEYSAHTMNSIKEKYNQSDNINSTTYVLSDEENLTPGKTGTFGMSITPAPLSTGVNVFNLITATGPIYKNNATAYVNTIEDPIMENALIHDADRNKGVAFKESDVRNVQIRFEVNPNDLFGATKFNTIELVPYIPGSFDLTSVCIYTITDYKTKEEIPSYMYSTQIKSAGACRLVFEEPMDLYACELELKINFQNLNGKYPFGFKHVYFLNTSYMNDSYYVLQINKENYIDYISEDIIIHDQNGYRESTVAYEGIELYTMYNEGTFTGKIATSKGLEANTIAKNTKTIYAKIPVKKSIISIKFKEIAER